MNNKYRIKIIFGMYLYGISLLNGELGANNYQLVPGESREDSIVIKTNKELEVGRIYNDGDVSLKVEQRLK